MKILKGELLLDNVDIDKLVLHHLKEVEATFENHYDDIVDGNFDMTPLKIFSPTKMSEAHNQSQFNDNNSAIELKCVELYIKEYFDDLKQNKATHRTIIKQIGRLEHDEIPIIKNFDRPADWVKHTRTALRGLDKYIDGKVEAYNNNEDFTGSIHPRIKSCLRVIEEERTKSITSSSNTRTSWNKVFAEFAQKKKHDGISDNLINDNRYCLLTAFTILDKKYVETITYKDCQKLSNLIHKVPRKWDKKYSPTKLRELLKDETDETTNKLSSTSIIKYLRTFKEFLKYCKKKRLINDTFDDDLEIPRRRYGSNVDGFTRDELKTIFNPSTYPRKDNIYYGYRYWIPLIGLYTGCRLNEICQLYCDDIKYEGRVWYFNITDDREDQHLKNKSAKRIIPIHPKLIELGFIKFVKEIKKSKKERLFYQLTHTQKNHYTHIVSMWFARYLKNLNIEGRNKVFHSIRHNVKSYLRDCGVPQEFQNKLCGWSASDIGERVYAGSIPIKRLHDEISKLDYPFLNKTLNELKKLNEKGK